jgi:hypothetical protein
MRDGSDCRGGRAHKTAATELRLTQRNSPSNRKTIGFGNNEAACPSGGGERERAVQARLGERDEQGWNVKIVGPEPIYEARNLNRETRRNGRMPRARFRRVRL